jgi:serine/threonine protein kinase
MIGKGAFGEVWKVKKEEGNEIFALKILNILKKDEEKMLKEVDILRILNNPGNINIVEIKD